MTTSNLPAVRNTAALAVRQPEPEPQPATRPAPLPLSTALLVVSAIAAFLAGVSVYAGRMEQAGLVGGVTVLMLFAAGIERWREHRE